MQISASLVKELRERTGAGMMECKRALTDTQGDLEAAIELMRKSGQAKADKKAGRVAAEGRVEIATEGGDAVILEVNSETDFVAKDENFANFVRAAALLALQSDVADVDALMQQTLDGQDLETRRTALIAKIGENVQVRRLQRLHSEGVLGAYTHGNRIGVLVAMTGGNVDLAKDVAMHIAASRPICVDTDGVPTETLDKEREIFRAQAAESGKPAEIVEKMVEGRVRKFLAEITLLGQPFVKNPEQSVAQLLKDQGATVTQFVRFEVGEGIEKKVENFAEEVMAQARKV